MNKPRFLMIVSLLFLTVFVSFNFSVAQHFVSMTDQQWVELALDMMRKGIQQQDTAKILKVFAPEISVKGGIVESRADLARELLTIFDNSYQRNSQLQKPTFPRADNPLHLSNFWDFDILDPEITIEGDSAVVECELVLWSDPPAQYSDQRGRRANEIFVFKTPPQIESPLPSGEYHRWPDSPSEKKRMGRIRSWKLERFEKLVEFLNEEINLSPEEKEGR